MGQLGGFAGANSGSIVDCLSATRLRGTSRLSPGGFCGENRGSLLRCVARGTVRGGGERAGLCPQQRGSCSQSFWVRTDGDRADGWADWDLSVAQDELGAHLLDGWDLVSVWHLDRTAGASGLCLREASPRPARGGHVIEIGDRQGLLECARRVNGGTDDGATYRLVADIDLGGASWEPIGLDPSSPLQCRFDGAGHRITNFVVRASRYPFAGLFGCVGERGSVHDLGVDCLVVGRGSFAAPLCAQNEGVIRNCTAIARTCASRCTGGLVAKNAGVVERCTASGSIGRGSPVPWWLVALLLLLLCLPLPIYFCLSSQRGDEVFAPVIIDPNATPIEPEQDLTPAPEEETDTSSSFIMNAEMYVSSENYAGTIGLRCPTWSTRGFVATVRLTPEDQQKIGYAGTGDYVTLYQSGLVLPGYGIDVITLGALPNGSRLPAGSYELSVLLEFYDVETNEKSAVDTTVPLEVTVG